MSRRRRRKLRAYREALFARIERELSLRLFTRLSLSLPVVDFDRFDAVIDSVTLHGVIRVPVTVRRRCAW